MIVVDTSALYAGFVADEPGHEHVVEAIRDERGPLILSPLVLAELDYLVGSRHTVVTEVSVLRSVSAGAFDIPTLDWPEIRAATDVLERYGDLDIGLTDASIVVLAERYATRRVLTLDRRHFGALRTSRGEPFELLP